MEDDKLKDLFSNYEPDLSSSFQFMTKLKKNMEAVEISGSIMRLKSASTGGLWRLPECQGLQWESS